MRRRVLLVLAVVAVLLVGSTSPSGAIIGGEYDANRHPNVGVVFALDDQGFGLGSCSGTLVSSTVFVSAAHCFDPATWAPDIPANYVVTFRPSLRQTSIGFYIIEDYIRGVAHFDPRYTPSQKKGSGNSQFVAQQDFDLGVVVLDQPATDLFPTIQPAPIARLGDLDQFTKGTRNRYFTHVGYGLQREFEPPLPGGEFIDYTRNFATAPLSGLTTNRLMTQGNPNDARGTGGICSGDSGGAVFLGATLVAVHSYSQHSLGPKPYGECRSVVGSVRLDTADARGFLEQFIALP
jgi:hypothetical protein